MLPWHETHVVSAEAANLATPRCSEWQSAHAGADACCAACGNLPWHSVQLESETPRHGLWHALQFFAIGSPLASRARECAEEMPPGMKAVCFSRFVTSPTTTRATMSSRATSESLVSHRRRSR